MLVDLELSHEVALLIQSSVPASTHCSLRLCSSLIQAGGSFRNSEWPNHSIH